MTIQKTIDDKTLNIALSGRLDATTTPEFDSAIKESIEDVDVLNLDFAELEYISSSGLRVLLYAHKVMSSKGEMTITNVNETIQEIFELTGFSDFLNIK